MGSCVQIVPGVMKRARRRFGIGCIVECADHRRHVARVCGHVTLARSERSGLVSLAADIL